MNTPKQKPRRRNVRDFIFGCLSYHLTGPIIGKELKQLRYGKAFVGGPFELVDAKTKTPFTQENLRGKWSLVYFGFTNCPDVCPEELDKMSAVVDRIGEDAWSNALK